MFSEPLARKMDCFAALAMTWVGRWAKGLVLVCVVLSALRGTAFAQAVSPLTRAETGFAFDLYGQLAKAPGNFFFSPYSVGTALGMLYAGAGGSTATEIAHSLHLENIAIAAGANGRGEFLQAVKHQPVGFGDTADGARLARANALWGGENADLDPAYVRVIHDIFDGGIFRVDFAKPVGTAAKIDKWVAAQTGGKIRDLISADQLNGQTQLVLTNAVYFQAGWANPFDSANTVRARFHVAPGRDVATMMMNQTHAFEYAAGHDLQMISLDYRHDDASMIIILPDKVDGLAGVEAAMTPAVLDGLMEHASYTKIQLEMPKFVAESSFDLPSVLEALGMRQAFDPVRADLTGIADVASGRLFVSDVVHKAFVNVDEVGTVAAAATGITVATATAMLPTPPIPFIADHPFLYLIRDNATGEILFMGRMSDPSG